MQIDDERGKPVPGGQHLFIQHRYLLRHNTGDDDAHATVFLADEKAFTHDFMAIYVLVPGRNHALLRFYGFISGSGSQR